MALPEAESARVDLEKLTGYLLSKSHPIGRSKARFFRGLGFNESNSTLLQRGLMRIAKEGVVVQHVTSRHGVKYVLDGEMQTPLGSRVTLRTIWIIDAGQQHPRFVTAYPL
jgi:hypothetical protein